MNLLAITMHSLKKLNTYGIESPCECLPGVGSFLANPGLSKEQLVPSCTMRVFQSPNTFIGIPTDTYGVDPLITCITQGRLTPTIGYQTYNAYSVDLQLRHWFVYFITQFTPPHGMNEWGIMGKYIMLMALDDSHRVLPHIIAFRNSRQIGVWFESYHTPICSISSRKMNGLTKWFQPSLEILTFCLPAASNKCDRAFAGRGIWNSVEAFRQATACSCHNNTLDKHRA